LQALGRGTDCNRCDHRAIRAEDGRGKVGCLGEHFTQASSDARPADKKMLPASGKMDGPDR
jgi:hypothetical protein